MSLVKSFDIAQSANFQKKKKKKNEIQNHLFFTKKELPISKFKKIHATEVRHGMQLGEAYVNDTSTGVMINFIGDSIAFILKNTLENCIFSAF